MKKEVLQVNLINHLPHNETFVLTSKSYLEAIFQKLLIRTSLSELSHKIRIPINNLSRYHSGSRSIPLVNFIKLLRLANFDIIKLQGKLKLRIGRNGTFLKISPNICIDSEWVYISEILRGDGYLSERTSSIVFINKNRDLVNFVISFFKKVGLKKSNIYLYEKRKDALFITIRSKLLVQIFHKIFKIPVGKKGEMKLPDFMKKSIEFSAAAIAGIFDAEGSIQHVRTTSRRITISMITENYLKDIQQILLNFGISSVIRIDKSSRTNSIYRLYIFNQSNLKKFYQIINFKHPGKKIKLKKLIDSFDKNRIVELSLRAEVLNSIKNGNNVTRSIVTDLNLPFSKIRNQLYRLQKNNLIVITNKIYTNKGCYAIFRITDMGEKFLANHHVSTLSSS